MEKILNNYEINEKTMALLPAAHIDYDTIVLEVDRKLLVRKTPLQLIKRACLDAYSTYEGRRAAVTHQTGFKKKVPVPIHPSKKIFAFPTHSPESFDCKWLFFHHILDFKPTPTALILEFKNGLELPMKESQHIMERQMQRTAVCLLKLSSISQPHPYAFPEQISYLLSSSFPYQTPPIPERV